MMHTTDTKLGLRRNFAGGLGNSVTNISWI